MRAVYLSGCNFEQEELIIEGNRFHHLVNVVRVKIGDEILVLDGLGNTALTTIISINKKVAHLLINERKTQKQNFNFTVALCLPKRDALDLCLKQIVEIGIKKVFLISSDYSVNKSVKTERLERIIESSMEQSNNPFKTHLEKINSLSEIDLSQFDQVFCLSSQDNTNTTVEIDSKDNCLLIIGPEGGFSENERELLSQSFIKTVKLDTNILRTPTAIAVGAGYLLSHVSKN